MLASMLNGQGQANPFGNLMANPAALIAFSGKGGGSLKDIMMLQMIQGCGLGAPAKVVAPTAVVAPVEDVAPVETPAAATEVVE